MSSNRFQVLNFSLYDWGNSAFTTLVVTFIYSAYFTKAIAPDGNTGTVYWSRAITATALLVALSSPVLGNLADRRGSRRKFLALSTLVCVIMTAVLAFIRPGQVYTALAVFVVANLAFELGMVFYNSFLPDIATPENIGRISGFAWGMGYAGGLVCMGLALVGFVITPDPWLGTTGGVSRFNGSAWTGYNTDNGLADNWVNDIAIDHEGSLWFATWGKGVSKFDGTGWTTYTDSAGLADNNVYAIAVDPEGNKWFGTENGVSRFDGVSWITYTKEDGLADNGVRAVAVDRDGSLWFAAWKKFGVEGQGVSRFDGTGWTTYTDSSELADNSVYSIAVDPEGNLWFGTTEGASKFDGAAWTAYTTKDGLADNNVYAIAIDSAGGKWFATWGGVSRFDGAGWTTYTRKNGLADNVVKAAFADPDGNLWFGTTGGVSKFDGMNWTTYTTSNGLADNVVKAIAMGPDDNLWLGSSRGEGFHIRATNLLTALWFLVFCLPFLVFVKEKKRLSPPAARGIIKSSFIQLARSFSHLLCYRQLLRFLLARLIYNDGLVTIFSFGGIYAGVTFGFEMRDILIFGIVLNLAAGSGAFLFGFFDDKVGAKATIMVSLIALSVAALVASATQSVLWFWAAAIVIGIFAGPNQSASRSLMGRFSPIDREAEFFGFFAFSGKFSSFLGPLTLGIVTGLTHSQRWGVSTVVLFFLIGGLILLPVNQAEGQKEARQA
ncbi:MAG TPA: MFS transporter [archaeon]|nr:MFS transporter [archaeon]